MTLFKSLSYIKHVTRYAKNSKLGRQQILSIQDRQWRSLLAYSQKYSRYYARVMKEHNLSIQTAQPEDFPVLTKQVIHEHFDEIVTDPRIRRSEVHQHAMNENPAKLYLGKYHILKTSGSSGQPGYFVFDDEEMISGIAPSVARAPAEVARRKRRLTLIGFPTSFAGSSQTVRFGNSLWIAKRFVDYRPVSIEQPFPQVVQQLNDFQPHIVSGYAKLLLLLADAQRRGQLSIKPDSLQSGGEQLLESDRRYLREIFQCPVNNHYGSTEGFSLGICRDGDNSLELFEDHIHFRLGSEETYITNLHSRTMPLINYQIRDVLMPRPMSEAAPFRRVESTIGRSDEIPYFTTEENGRLTVHPLAFDPIMPKEVKSFFMSCAEPNHVAFHIFLDENFYNQKEAVFTEVRTRLKLFFAEKNLSNVVFKVVHETDYGVNHRTGKTQFWRQTL